MSKKKLLEESTVRSFMKLANLQPLSDKFIKEGYGTKEEELNEAEEEDEESEKSEKSPASKKEEESVEEGMETRPTPSDRMQGDKPKHPLGEEGTLAEVEEMKEDALEEGNADGLKPLKGAKVPTGGKPAQAKQGKPKATSASVSKPNQGPTQTKMAGVQAAKKIASKDPNNGKMVPLKVSTKHVSHGTPVKLSESLDEEEMGPPPEGEVPTPSDEAGEGAGHQETVKDALQKMLSAMQDIAKEYGVDMSVDAGGEEDGEMESPEAESPEAGPPESAPPASEEEEEAVMQETLDLLTKRVAARLLKRK